MFIHRYITNIYSNIIPHTGRGGRTPVFGSLSGVVKQLDALHGRLESDALVGGAQPLGVEEGGVLAIPQVIPGNIPGNTPGGTSLGITCRRSWATV